MLEQRRNQLSVALHIDVVFNLIVLSVFLFVRNLDLFAYIVVIICPIYAYGAFKHNSIINYWVSARLDYIDSIFIKWILKNRNRHKRNFFKKFLPHSDLNTIFFDIPMPIDSSKFKKKANPEEKWNKISEEDSDPFHISKTTLDLAQQFIQDEKSLTADELKRLNIEGSYRERELLETHLPPDHPILLRIDEKLKIEISNGLTILK
ncbi:MAG: hypothetical protein ACTSVL_06990 [Promethearchaeota archaeon]